MRNKLLTASLVTVLGCASCATHPAPVLRVTGPAAPAAGRALSRHDALWLERVTFGLNSQSLAEYRRLGREKYLDAQLAVSNAPLPPAVAAQIQALDITHQDLVLTLASVDADYKALNDTADSDEKERAKKALNERGNRLAYEAARRELLRAVYAPNQLQELMVWFWLNHFNVHEQKARLRWLVADYEESAIRPHVFGHFRDLVLATLEHPAMLQYLDNAQNAAGHVNENYARELMELHTLGVGSGYTQQDVQQLALILTGAGVNVRDAPHLKPELGPLYLRRGAFEFNPARHDFSQKTLLGHAVRGAGFTEIEEAVKLIVAQPACAKFISRQLATYFVADNPPEPLVAKMARTFQSTDGDIAAVLRTMLLSPEFNDSLGTKFKDPMRFVVSSVRFAYDAQVIDNSRPLLNWLRSLDEAPFGHATPDGYALVEANWASAGQMSKRFEIARAVGSGNAGLFTPEDGNAQPGGGFPKLSSRLFFEALEPALSKNTQSVLSKATSQQEWNTFLLASPDFNYE